MTTIEQRAVSDAAPAGAEPPGPAAARQIAPLRHLPDGWRNGEGAAFNSGYLDWLADAFTRMYPPNAPAPLICDDLPQPGLSRHRYLRRLQPLPASRPQPFRL